MILLAVLLGGLPAAAQNNTGYPSGTKCADLIEPRRSICHDAFDPRPNPREILKAPKPGVLAPPKAPALQRDATPTNPKVPHAVPPPILRGLQP
ncbi:hypothetical protein [Dongia sp.]|uniref:hypothetical protein n=1 Tax=Dongia sp. TaxID=1977262 RepID=UPI0035AF9F72